MLAVLCVIVELENKWFVFLGLLYIKCSWFVEAADDETNTFTWWWWGPGCGTGAGGGGWASIGRKPSSPSSWKCFLNCCWNCFISTSTNYGWYPLKAIVALRPKSALGIKFSLTLEVQLSYCFTPAFLFETPNYKKELIFEEIYIFFLANLDINYIAGFSSLSLELFCLSATLQHIKDCSNKPGIE